MDLFITRRGGGSGGGLNFTVVGGTIQPANPAENTIWVNTDVEITRWSIALEDPDVPEEGMVFIHMAAFGSVELNAAEVNELRFYPSTAKQYVNGEWISKAVSVYHNSEWVDMWNTVLYQDGMANVPLGMYQSGGTVRFDETNIYCYIAAGKYGSAYAMLGPIPIDNVKSISADITSTTVRATTNADIFIDQFAGGYDNAPVKMRGNVGSKATVNVSIDLSSAGLTGQYFVFVGTLAPDWSNERGVRVNNIRAEMSDGA